MSIDVGQRWGKLTAVKLDHANGEKQYWLFECECGGSIVRGIETMKKGKTLSCKKCQGLPDDRDAFFIELHQKVRKMLFGG